MSKTRAALYVGIITLLLLGAVLEYFQGQRVAAIISQIPGLQTLLANNSYVSTATSTTANGSSGVATSSPVNVVSDQSSDTLNVAEIIALTNNDRSTVADLPPLKENIDLDIAAANKLKDMFSKQYFAHVSPSGTGPGDLASVAGYDYVVEGENLAEGGFKNAQDRKNNNI